MKDEARRALRESAGKAWVNSEFYQHPTNDYPEHIVFADGYGAGYFDGLTAASRWRSIEKDGLPTEEGHYTWRRKDEYTTRQIRRYESFYYSPAADAPYTEDFNIYTHYQKIEFTPEQGTED